MTKEVLIGMLVVGLSAWSLHAMVEREAAKGLRFQLQFEDGANLKAGDSVYMQGVDVGEVLDVDLDADRKVKVAVKLTDRFKGLVSAEAQYFIASDKFIFGKKAVLVMPPAGPGTPVREGQLIKGVEGYTEMYLKKTAGHARKLWDRFKGWVVEDRPDDKPEDPRGEPQEQ
jgi:ABC-type transporter Mla subunit MlaD